MTAALTLLGVLIVFGALSDIFLTLLHPSGQGWLTRFVLSQVWRATRTRAWTARLAGPLGMAAVVVCWTGLVVVGWALVYWPQMPHAFAFSGSLVPAERNHAADALYLSLVTLATLGFGDIAPQVLWLRLVTPIESLIGFALLTAAVSWVLQVYPALGRRRALAVRLSMLRDSAAADNLATADGARALLLHDLSAELARARVDLAQYGETFYFHDGDDRSSLPRVLGYVAELSATATASPVAEIQFAGEVLHRCLTDLTDLLARYLLPGSATPNDILAAYARTCA